MENTDLNRARQELEHSRHTCVLCRGASVCTADARGVAPLLELLDSGVDLTGFSAADRIVGQAAAFLYLRLGVAAVYAPVMSESAKARLESGGIRAVADTLVPRIINRAGDGICPMEQAVTGLDDPAQAEAAIRARVARMAGRKEQP